MKEFTQPQCEAMIDLLCLALTTDSHVSATEELAAHVSFAKIGWHSTQPRELFIAESLARAERMTHAETRLVGYLADRTTPFTTVVEKRRVLSLLMLIMEIDGFDESEDTFLARVQVALGLE
jgi:hypothetical protein